MIYQIGDRNVVIDCAANQPGDILQRREQDAWRDVLRDGRPVVASLLPPSEDSLGMGGMAIEDSPLIAVTPTVGRAVGDSA